MDDDLVEKQKSKAKAYADRFGVRAASKRLGVAEGTLLRLLVPGLRVSHGTVAIVSAAPDLDDAA